MASIEAVVTETPALSPHSTILLLGMPRIEEAPSLQFLRTHRGTVNCYTLSWNLRSGEKDPLSLFPEIPKKPSGDGKCTLAPNEAQEIPKSVPIKPREVSQPEEKEKENKIESVKMVVLPELPPLGVSATKHESQQPAQESSALEQTASGGEKTLALAKEDRRPLTQNQNHKPKPDRDAGASTQPLISLSHPNTPPAFPPSKPVKLKQSILPWLAVTDASTSGERKSPTHDTLEQEKDEKHVPRQVAIESKGQDNEPLSQTPKKAKKAKRKIPLSTNKDDAKKAASEASPESRKYVSGKHITSPLDSAQVVDTSGQAKAPDLPELFRLGHPKVQTQMVDTHQANELLKTKLSQFGIPTLAFKENLIQMTQILNPRFEAATTIENLVPEIAQIIEHHGGLDGFDLRLNPPDLWEIVRMGHIVATFNLVAGQEGKTLQKRESETTDKTKGNNPEFQMKCAKRRRRAKMYGAQELRVTVTALIAEEGIKGSPSFNESESRLRVYLQNGKRKSFYCSKESYQQFKKAFVNK